MREGGRVDIEAAKVDGKLRLAVKDTGVGLSSEAAGEAGTGVGLANIRERLKTLYGDSGKLVLQENQPRGMIAAIEIPYVETNQSTAG
jgi:LytS/YehU family sensor histidine kinase